MTRCILPGGFFLLGFVAACVVAANVWTMYAEGHQTYYTALPHG